MFFYILISFQIFTLNFFDQSFFIIQFNLCIMNLNQPSLISTHLILITKLYYLQFMNGLQVVNSTILCILSKDLNLMLAASQDAFNHFRNFYQCCLVFFALV